MYGIFTDRKVALDPSHPGRDVFHIVFGKGALPDPGALIYAYQSLGLSPFSPIGHGVPVRQPFREAIRSMFVNQSVALAPTPTLTGQFMSQPLVNPGGTGGQGTLPEDMGQNALIFEGALAGLAA